MSRQTTAESPTSELLTSEPEAFDNPVSADSVVTKAEKDAADAAEARVNTGGSASPRKATALCSSGTTSRGMATRSITGSTSSSSTRSGAGTNRHSALGCRTPRQNVVYRTDLPR